MHRLKRHASADEFLELVTRTADDERATVQLGRDRHQPALMTMLSLHSLTSKRRMHYTISRDRTDTKQWEDQSIARALQGTVHKDRNKMRSGLRDRASVLATANASTSRLVPSEPLSRPDNSSDGRHVRLAAQKLQQQGDTVVMQSSVAQNAHQQRPQPGTINDQVAAQIMQGLQTELPKFQRSWQATVPLGARAARVMQL
jgi:hypothetical protein